MNCWIIVSLALVTVLTNQTLDYIYVSARLGKTLIRVLFWFVWRKTKPKYIWLNTNCQFFLCYEQ